MLSVNDKDITSSNKNLLYNDTSTFCTVVRKQVNTELDNFLTVFLLLTTMFIF